MANGLLQRMPTGLEGLPYGFGPQDSLSAQTQTLDQPQGFRQRAKGILGNIGGFFQNNPDLLDTLAIGFGGMSQNPNQALMQQAAGRIQQRQELALRQDQLNRTAEFLRSQGYDDLAQIVLSTGNAGAAMGQYQEREARKTALPVIRQLDGKIISIDQSSGDINTLYESPPQAVLPVIRELDGKIISVDQSSGAIRTLYESPPEGPDAEAISSLRQEFAGTKPVQNFIEIGFAYDKVANTPATAAGDLALVFNYMKLLDPGSVVRESEFRSAAQARAWLGRLDESGQGSIVPANIRAAIQGATEGTILLPEQREDFRNVSRGIFEGARGEYERQANFFRDLAIQQDINPNYIIPDYGFGSQGNNEATIISVTPRQQ